MRFLMLVVGIVVSVLNRRWPRLISIWMATWLFATLSIWMALLRMPLYGWCSLTLAAGLGRVIAGAVVSRDLLRPRMRRMIFGGLVAVLGMLAAGSSGWQAVREYRTVAGLTAPPADPLNVILIVWDTVRAYDLSLYGYRRETTPHLAGGQRRGSSTIWRYRRRHGLIRRTRVFSRASGRSVSIRSGSSIWMRRCPRWRNT